jgi:class 3 adenylate cyclase
MCVFGLRATRGDEAQRAVAAGRDLVAAGGSGLPRPAVHAGIEYGEVLVTPSWEPAGYGVWGRPVNLAKRLCDTAGPGELAIGPAAYARAGVLGAAPVRVQVKGVADPVDSHRIPAAIPPAPALVAAGRLECA